MYELTVEREFSAAHYLREYDGDCARMHGHNYRVQITVCGEQLDEAGMLLDFGDLKRVVREQVVDPLDHRDLNEILPTPTAECLALWAWERLEAAGLPLAEIQVQETANCWVVYRGEGVS